MMLSSLDAAVPPPSLSPRGCSSGSPTSHSNPHIVSNACSRTGRRAFWAGFTICILLWLVTNVRQQDFGTSRWGLLMVILAGVSQRNRASSSHCKVKVASVAPPHGLMIILDKLRLANMSALP